MSARRQASTTSLSQYARTSSPVGQHGSLDFCNAFWGFRDQGFDVLSRRMKGAIHTTEELRNFWKERAAIEEDYAKRLSKLCKVVLGKDEVGDLRRSLDTIKDETDKQATFHLTLAQQIRTELETACADFLAKQNHHKKAYLASIEKQCKAKQLQEQHVDKAREKYEQDCMKINSYTAQSSLVQGKDLEKIQLKLDRAKQTVQANEREFANFTRAFESTVLKWEQDWKAFCDGCQDLEEARSDFMKDNMWSYANLVSTVCVADDEACERVRVSLEQIETEREIENFVSVYGTGSQIPDPPTFVNYQLPDAIPSSASQPTFRYASFTRSSARDVPIQLHRNSTYVPPPSQDDDTVNTAGRGAGGGGTPRRADVYPEANNLARQSTQRNSTYGLQQPPPLVNGNGAPGHSPSSSQNYQNHSQMNGIPNFSTSPGAASSSVPLQRRPTNAASSSSQPQSAYRPSTTTHDPHAETVDPTAETYIKVGGHAYKVDPSKDPQTNPGLSGIGPGPTNRLNGSISPAAKQNGIDPLQKQLEELQSGLSASGSNRRNTVYRGQAQATSGVGSSVENALAGPSRHRGNDSLSVGQPSSRSPPANSPSPGASVGGSQPIRDYRNSADLVVGAPPPSTSRPASPNPPTANFMIPKNTSGPSNTEVMAEVLADYHQSLPGERKANGSTSRRASFISQHMQNSSTPTNVGVNGYGHGHSLSVSSQIGQTPARPSSAGHAGIGAHGGQSRSNSPQPPPSRGPSPGPGEVVNVATMVGQSPHQQHQNPPQQPPQQARRNSSYITPPAAGTPVRSTSPNPVGIALDPTGRVSHDEMAQRYQIQQQQQRGQTPQSHSQAYGGIQQQPPLNQQQPQQQRRSSWLASSAGPPASMVPPVQPAYSPVTPPPPPPQAMNMYQVPPPPNPQPQQGYITPAPGQQGVYGQYSQQQQPTGYQQPPPQQQQQQQPQNTYAMVNNALVGRQQRANSVASTGYNTGSVPPSQSSSSLTVRSGTMEGGHRGTSPVGMGPGAVVQLGRSPSPQPMVQQVPPHMQQMQQMPPQVQQMQMTHQHQHQLPMQQIQITALQSVHQQMQGQGQQGQGGQGRFGISPPQHQQMQPGQTTEDGTPILFYVKALYDYQATIEEEFDFQTGDIIAVTSTPDDGWWSGELLDEARRQRGRHIFPSNFVCLF